MAETIVACTGKATAGSKLPRPSVGGTPCGPRCSTGWNSGSTRSSRAEETAPCVCRAPRARGGEPRWQGTETQPAPRRQGGALDRTRPRRAHRGVEGLAGEGTAGGRARSNACSGTGRAGTAMRSAGAEGAGRDEDGGRRSGRGNLAETPRGGRRPSAAIVTDGLNTASGSSPRPRSARRAVSLS